MNPFEDGDPTRCICEWINSNPWKSLKNAFIFRFSLPNAIQRFESWHMRFKNAALRLNVVLRKKRFILRVALEWCICLTGKFVCGGVGVLVGDGDLCLVLLLVMLCLGCLSVLSRIYWCDNRQYLYFFPFVYIHLGSCRQFACVCFLQFENNLSFLGMFVFYVDIFGCVQNLWTSVKI